MERTGLSPVKTWQHRLQEMKITDLGKMSHISLKWSQTPQYRYHQIPQTHTRHPGRCHQILAFRHPQIGQTRT